MKKLFCFLLLSTIIPRFSFAGPIVHELKEGWKFRQQRAGKWYPAEVPGVVHTDLIRNGIIEDPFFRLNERSVQWIDKEDWIYELDFTPDAAILEKGNIRLFFKGLDTYADVYLNDEKICSAYNMFRDWKVDIKGKLKEGKNTLRVYFHSPIKKDMPKWDALPFQYDASNDQSENGGVFNKKLSVFARKAGYHYGWDWGPRLVTSGIWRPVLLEAWDDFRIEDVFVQQQEVTARKAVINTVVEVLSDKAIPDASITVRNGETSAVLGTVKTALKPGLNTVTVAFTINNPKLWWSNGLGQPDMYKLETTLMQGNQLRDSVQTRVGIRSLRLINEPDKDGRNLYFELNGIPVFAKGANYIPADVFLPRISREVYRKEIEDAYKANMNMLRVWGGGIYEDDAFYELCDEHGILVWQDFMFACSMYPADGDFLDNVKQEAIDNIRRLRNHPSIALWCGNNEITEAWFGWGWKLQHEQKDPAAAKLIWQQYLNLFHTMLPETVKACAPGSYYRPSSPYSRVEGVSEADQGDSHYWRVWHAKAPISDYNRERSRFFSEYGFQSFPEFATVKQYAPLPGDWNIGSEVMMAHQRGGDFANELIRDYMLKNYDTPKDFQRFLYMSQVLQGDAIKTAIEAHRRDRPYCMGTLFWQHNDCWPVASWSGRDYYRRWKAQHYFTRKAYRDLLVSPIAKGDTLQIHLASDRLKAGRGTLTLELKKLDGTPVSSTTRKIAIPANTSKMLWSTSVRTLLGNLAAEDVFISVKLLDETGNLYSNQYFLVKPKELRLVKPAIHTTVESSSNGVVVTLQSEQLVRAAFLSIDGGDHFFEDNYMNLLPGESLRIPVTTSLTAGEFRKRLTILSLNDMADEQ